MNAITAFVDASNVYGSHLSDNNILRTTKPPGSLKYTPGKNILPKVGNTDPQFRAGDARAREMPGLLSMHTIWMREHNRIGKKGGNKRAYKTQKKFSQGTIGFFGSLFCFRT